MNIRGTALALALTGGLASLSSPALAQATQGRAPQAAAAPQRPQDPVPPYPYTVEDVSVPNARDGVTLAGTLTVPEGPGPFPGVVLVSGSGPQDRDESLMGHKPFLVLADHLTRRGIAVLRYDDRGVGGSTGTFATATTRDFTTDALAAVAFLGLRNDVAEVGIVGHSEGGLVGPMAATRSPEVAFVVMLAGPGLPGHEIVQLQSRLIAEADRVPDQVLRANLGTQARIFDVVREEPDSATAADRVRTVLRQALADLPAELREAMGDQASDASVEAQVRQVTSPWFRFFLTYDPRPPLARVQVPVLALNGSLDLQVPADANLAEIAAALARGGNTDVSTEVLPELNHLFQTATTGSPAEYARISETMSPLAMERVSSWILQRFSPTR